MPSAQHAAVAVHDRQQHRVVVIIRGTPVADLDAAARAAGGAHYRCPGRETLRTATAISDTHTLEHGRAVEAREIGGFTDPGPWPAWTAGRDARTGGSTTVRTASAVRTHLTRLVTTFGDLSFAAWVNGK
jgi:hypothetical protein